MILYAYIDHGVISEIQFEGRGCSISMASCSMMTDAIRDQTVAEAHNMINQFELMIKTGIALDHPSLLDASSLSGVHPLRGRHNCALMGWQALALVLQQYETQ